MQNCKEKSKADSVKHGAGSTQMRSGRDDEMAAEGPGERVGFPTDPCLAQAERLRHSAESACIPAAGLYSVLANAAQKTAYLP